MRHAFPFIKELLGITRVLIHRVWPSGINQPQWIKAAGDSFWLQFKKKKKKVNWPSHSEMKQAAPGGGVSGHRRIQAALGTPLAEMVPASINRVMGIDNFHKSSRA